MKAEEELRRRNEQFRRLFEDVPAGLYRAAPDGRLLMANPALIRMLGYTSFDQAADADFHDNCFGPRARNGAPEPALDDMAEIRGLESSWTRSLPAPPQITTRPATWNVP